MITDTHFGLSLNNLDKWSDMMESTFYEFVIPYLKKNVKEGDILIHLGDLYDNRTYIPIITSYKVEKILIELSNILPLHILVGNHDLWNKGSNDINSIRLFNYIHNIYIHTKTDTIELDGKKLVIIPWVSKRLDMIAEIDSNSGDYLFCHSDLNGCKMHLTSVAHKNADMIDITNFKKYKRVFSGHIHLSQVTENHMFIGSLYQMDRNDIGNKKGITILDLSTDEVSFHENNYSPIFKKIKILSEEDIDDLDELKGTKDYIDLSISNNLLITNRKLRRKLEIMLEKGNFASVDYIDDITKELVDDEINENIVNIENEEIDISVQLEYEDYIKEYILKQNYDNDKFKEGVMTEMDEIIKIYNENYKAKNSNDV